MDLCFSLKCTKNRDDDYQKRGGNLYTIPNYVTDDYILSCHTNSFNSLINLKNDGNRYYKSYKFNQAVQCYTKALASFSQEKNENNQSSKSNINESSFDFSNVVVNTSINEIDQNKLSNVLSHKNSLGVPLMSSSMISTPSHPSSPLATSSKINIVSNSKNNSNSKQFPSLDGSSYRIIKKKGDDEYSNALDKYFEENRVEASFNSTSPKSPDINPKAEFINNVEAQYQNQFQSQTKTSSNSQNVELRHKKNKSKHHKKNKSKHQPIYTPHPKIKPADVMILYSTLLANRSASYIRLKEYSKANKDAEHIIEIRPNWIKGYYRKAEALKGLKRYLESLDYYHQALKFNPSSEKILNAISTIEILLRNEELGIKIYQLVPGYDICVKKSIFKPIQYILFSYALQMQNYIYILADVKSKQCILIDACWDIEGILEHVHKEKLKVIGAIYTHFHIDHTGGIPPPPYNKYMVKVEGMVKLSKIFPDIPFFIGPRDIEFVMKQNPDFNKNRFVPIEDKQILTLDDIINLNKSKVKRRSHINEKIRATNQEKIVPSKDNLFSEGDEGKIDDSDISQIKNENVSGDDALIEKDDNFVDKNSTLDNDNNSNNNNINNKLCMPIKGRPISDYKTKHLSNLNEEALLIPDDNGTDVYSNCNLNDVSNNDFDNAVSETSGIENSNMGNISNILYDGENSLKFYSNISEQDGNNLDSNKDKIPPRGIPFTSTLERPTNKSKSIEENKNYPYSNRLNDTISTISMINIDKKDYSSNVFGKSSNKIDDFRIQFIFTPGHTLGSMCILVNEERLFSGDTLLIGTCGRIDLPESAPEEMYDSLMNVLSRLDDDIVVYPGHSYGGDEWTTIAQEKLFGSMYNYGNYDTWLFELTGCVKNSDGTSSNTQENKNEMMAMVPVSSTASLNRPKLENKISKKELYEEPKSNKDEEKVKETLNNSVKKDEERKGYFSNHEYFDMNNINGNNKYYKPTNSSPVAGPSTINVELVPASSADNLNTASTGKQSHTSDTNNTPNPLIANRRKTNSSSNRNSTVVFSKRKESLTNKPRLQKQQYQMKLFQKQPQQPFTTPAEVKNNPPRIITTDLDKEGFNSEKNIIKNNAIVPPKTIVELKDIKGRKESLQQEDEVSSISSSSSTSSESLSISSSSSSVNEIENYTNNSMPLKDNVRRPISKQSLKEKPFIDTGAKLEVVSNGLTEELSPIGVNSYDHIIPSSIKEQLNKSSELDESYDSGFDRENYERNRNILSGLSQSSFGTSSISPLEKNNLMMTEMYPNEDESSSSSSEEDDMNYGDGDPMNKGRRDKVRKKKSFLNNVFKKKSFERKHYIIKTED